MVIKDLKINMDETIQDEPVVTDQVEDTTPSSNEADKLKELSAQKAHWREKAIKSEEARKSLEDKLAKFEAQPKPDTNTFATKEEVTDIKLGQLGFDVETATYIKTYARGAGKNPLEVLEDPFVKTFVDTKKSKEALNNSIPSPSGRTISVDGKSLTQMSKAEREANWGKIVAGVSKK